MRRRALITQITFLLFALPLIFSSCIKRDHKFIPRANYAPSGNAGNIIDTLKGKEFLFDNLIWEYNDNGDNVFIYISNMPDLFKDSRDMEILLMPDSSSGWVPVRKSEAELPYYGFCYHILSYALNGIYNYVFVIMPRPFNTSLEGKIASVKIKFL